MPDPLVVRNIVWSQSTNQTFLAKPHLSVEAKQLTNTVDSIVTSDDTVKGLHTLRSQFRQRDLHFVVFFKVIVTLCRHHDLIKFAGKVTYPSPSP